MSSTLIATVASSQDNAHSALAKNRSVRASFRSSRYPSVDHEVIRFWASPPVVCRRQKITLIFGVPEDIARRFRRRGV